MQSCLGLVTITCMLHDTLHDMLHISLCLRAKNFFLTVPGTHAVITHHYSFLWFIHISFHLEVSKDGGGAKHKNTSFNRRVPKICDRQGFWHLLHMYASISVNSGPGGISYHGVLTSTGILASWYWRMDKHFYYTCSSFDHTHTCACTHTHTHTPTQFMVDVLTLLQNFRHYSLMEHMVNLSIQNTTFLPP